MAPPAGTLRVGRYFVALGVLVAILYAIVFLGSRQTPKLGIDLVGGIQVRFTAKTQNGGVPPASSMSQARQILSERVNGTGVTQATVVVQGNNQLVVSIPGHDATDVQKLGAAAVLNFRGVVTAAVPVTCQPTTSGRAPVGSSVAPSGSSAPSAGATSTGTVSPPKASPGASHSAQAAAARPLAQAPSGTSTSAGSSKAASSTKAASSSKSASATAPASPSASSPAGSSAAAPVACRADSLAQAAKQGNFSVPLSDTEYAKLTPANQSLLNNALSGFDCASAQTEPDVPKNYFVACAPGSDYGVAAANVAFLLGPVIVPGTQIDSADAIAPNGQNPVWTVSLTLKGKGSASWGDYTSAHNVNGDKNSPGVTACAASSTPCSDYVAFTLDGIVVSAPVNESAINGQATQITGNFTASSAKDLANKLKYGALPLSFTADKAESVSATVGSSQLKAGMLAGGIGLILVVIYSLMYYRALGLVTVASLLVSGVLTYGCLVMLGTQIDFTLTLAGIAGFIVAIGITADSFVVFFERLKDEVHEGRSVRVAVPRAWVRARRTILSADTVSFLAAAVLWYFTTDEVRGFAFTLGLSTILDLIVVFLFTHPLVSLLSRSQAFGSARFTGLDALRGSRDPDAVPRRARTARAQSADGAESEPDRSFAGVAVLEKRPADQPREETLDAVAADAGFDEPLDEDADQPADEPVDETPRRRTAPEPGSAAERAAARRARMREQRGRKDEG